MSNALLGDQRAGVRLARGRPPEVPAPDLDVEQRAVIEHDRGNLLVLAGPGTGKTTTLAELVVSRLRVGPRQLDASRVLALTFGRRASGELAERVARRLGGGPVPVIATFHSYAYGVLRQFASGASFLNPPRLLTAAEQEADLRELLTSSIAEGRLKWPDELSGAIGTRGIAEQVRALLARARSQGLDGAALARHGRAGGVPVWGSVGRFFEEYLTILDSMGSLDYSELIDRAATMAGRDDPTGRAMRAAHDLILVDEYQDTDPAQIRLLKALSRGGAQVVVVGDPDQAIYSFRGADVRGIERFAEEFADPITGKAARIVVLRTTRRFPAAIAQAAQRVLGDTLPRFGAEIGLAHRSPRAVPGMARVEVLTFPSKHSQGRGIAEVLLRAQAGLGDNAALDWSQMAVLVRSPALHAPPLARALRAAGIPVEMPADETALADEPAVQVLTGLVQLALGDPNLPSDTGRVLLMGAVGRIEPVVLRGLGRAALQAVAGSSVADSDAALMQALQAAVLPPGSPKQAQAGFDRVAGAITAARAVLEANGMVSEVLWAAWEATDWPERLRTAALRSRTGTANRDLDGLITLFDLAARLPAQRRGAIGISAFFAELNSLALGQELPNHGTSARSAVRLLSVHRAKGLEWDLVVVASVQEGEWPDLRLRSDLLHVNELGPEGRVEPRTHREQLLEERRLMYVACTRARRELIVTAVAEPYDGGAEPSRFLEQLGVERDLGVRSTPSRGGGVRGQSSLSLPMLVAELRAAATCTRPEPGEVRDSAEVESLRAAAIARLAGLAALGGSSVGPRPAPDAHPDSWWGVGELTLDSVQAELSEAPGPVRLSPSAIESLRRCPLQWFLEKRVGAGPTLGTNATIGTIVHSVAEALAGGELVATPDGIARVLDEIWTRLPFPAKYQQGQERKRIDEMIATLLRWQAASKRSQVGAEVSFSLELSGPNGLGAAISINGKIDRIDIDEHGRLHAIDFKTGKTAASAMEASEHPQLGVYQLALREGVAGRPEQTGQTELGGAELVFLGDTFSKSGMPKVRAQSALPSGRTWVHEVVDDAARLSMGPDFPARINSRCATCSFAAMCPAQVVGDPS